MNNRISVLTTILAIICKITFAQTSYTGYYPGVPRHYPSTDSLNSILKNAILKRNFHGIYAYHFSSTKNVNDTTKKYLLAILNWEIPKEELERKVDEYIADVPYKYAFNYKFWGGGLHDTIVNKVGYYAMDFDSLYHAYYDSLKLIYRDEVRAKIGERSIIKIPDEIVLSVAIAQIKEAIPTIKEDLNKRIKRFDTNASYLALAILGDTFFLSKVYEQHYQRLKRKDLTNEDLHYDIRTSTYLYTQKSVSLMLDWLDTTFVIKNFSSHPEFEKYEPARFVGSRIIPILVRFIKNENFNTEYLKFWQGKPYIDFDDVDERHIQFIRNWIKKQGKKFKFYLP